MPQKLTAYSQYGQGNQLLIAFHGYGMDGTQFRVLEDSFLKKYSVIGFHLPYHKNGPLDHENWIKEVKAEIRSLVKQYEVEQFSLAGYSIGSKVTLHLMEEFQNQIDEVFLFAPYGLENHWGLSFVTQGIGNAFFRLIVNTSLPEKIMQMVKLLRIIDHSHHEIIQKELLSKSKRKSLCKTLQMAGEIRIKRNELPDLINRNQIKCTIIYGQNDVLFPFKSRSISILSQLNTVYVDQVKEGHWLVTAKLDQTLANREIT